MSSYNDKIGQLAEIYRNYNIYPQECYTPDTAVQIIQREYPSDYYSQDIKYFLEIQPYKKEQRGADLPYWGKKYFTDEPGRRIMVISQDSLAEDAGSTVFYACLMDKFDDTGFRNFRKKHDITSFKSWKRTRDFLLEIGQLEYMFITDARKVYQRGLDDFDDIKSKELMNSEIEFCKPDLVVLLGNKTAGLFDLGLDFNEAIEKGVLVVNHTKFIVASFPSNANGTFEGKKVITLNHLRNY